MKKVLLMITLTAVSFTLMAKGMGRQFEIINDPKTGETKQVYITGVKLENDSKGNLLYSMALKDGWPDGPTIHYRPDGGIEEEENFKNGERAGFLKRYFDNGQLKQQVFYENGKKHGDEYIYDSDAKDGHTLRMQTHYNYGLKDGVEFSYDRGELYKQVSYRADVAKNITKLNGPMITYAKGGKISSREYYVDDQLHGIKQNYTKTGELKRETCFINGGAQKGLSACKGTDDNLETLKVLFENGKTKLVYQVQNSMLNGYHKTYNNSGILIAEENYINDKKQGAESNFYDDGKKYSLIHWEKGKKEGPSEWYYMNGKVEKLFNYKQGLFHGKQTYYFDDGSVNVESLYAMGKRHGVTKSFSSAGNLTYEADYKDDKLDGVVKSYNAGKLTQVCVFQEGLLLSIKEWDENGKLKSDNRYYTDGSRVLK